MYISPSVTSEQYTVNDDVPGSYIGSWFVYGREDLEYGKLRDSYLLKRFPFWYLFVFHSDFVRTLVSPPSLLFSVTLSNVSWSFPLVIPSYSTSGSLSSAEVLPLVFVPTTDVSYLLLFWFFSRTLTVCPPVSLRTSLVESRRLPTIWLSSHPW